MATWNAFERAAPDLAESGRRLLYQFGPGLAFLATVRADGGPRLHPICPAIVDGGLYAFLVPSPKQDDLRRDGRYALHSFPPANCDDEFYVTGVAEPVEEPKMRATVHAALTALGVSSAPEHDLFAFQIERAMHAAYAERGAWPPLYRRWRDPESLSR